MQRYAIFSPALGEQQGAPAILLADAVTHTARNVRLVNGEVWRARMRRAMLAPCEQPVLAYHCLFKSDATAYLFAFTAGSIYLWNGTEWASHVNAELTLGQAEHWSADSWGDCVIATNGVDKVLVGDNATAFAPLGSADGLQLDEGGTTFLTAAQYLTVGEGYVHLYDTVENGTRSANRVRWCAVGDMETWNATLDSGYMDVGDTQAVTGGKWLGNILYIFKERSIHRRWLGGENIFGGDELTRAYGCPQPRSAVELSAGTMAFFASDKTIRTQDGRILSEPIKDTLLEVPSRLAGLVRGCRVQEYQETWWSVPGSAGSTANDKTLVLTDGLRWTELDMGLACFGVYQQQTGMTIDGLDQVAPTIDGLDAKMSSIDYVESQQGFLEDIGVSGANTYAVHGATRDDGADYEGSFEIATDLGRKGQPIRYKRLLRLTVYLRPETAGLLRIDARVDERGWKPAGTLALTPVAPSDGLVIRHLPCDIRGRHFRLRISATTPFRLLGVLADFIDSGNT